jgi:tetratricopeptide (TPR) repeat protein
MLFASKRRLVVGAAFFFLVQQIATAQDEALVEKSRQANALMAAGKFEESIPLYKELIKAVPGNPGLILNLGLAEEMAGHPMAAIPQFEAVLKVQPNSVPALTSIAACRLQLNQPKLAIAPLEKLIAVEPANRNGRGMLAGALMAVDRFSEAAQQYRKLVAMDSHDAKAWYGLGKAYEALASNTFSRLEKIAPESGPVLLLVGDSQVSRQQYRSAFFFYKKAEEKAENLRGLHAALAKVYEQSGHHDWAQQETERESKLRPPNCVTHVAECKVVAGKFLEAVQTQGTGPESLFWTIKAYNQLAFEAFEQLGNLPESVEIHSLKADILKGHRQYLRAVDEWKAALRLAPGDPRIEHALAASLFQAQDYQSLMPMLEQALSRGQSSAETNFMMGASLLHTQQPDKAVAYLETALQQEPNLEVAHASLGLALAQLGRSSDAIPHLAKALSIDDDGSLHYQLARAYRATGDAEKAGVALQKYQQIQQANREQKEEVAREAQITAPNAQ